MSRKICVFGGSFNPPGMHHRTIARQLAEHFDEVVVVPCGPRPDKPVVEDVPPMHRAAMADMTFRGLDKVRVDLFDLEASTFSRAFELEERYASHAEVWHVVGGDLLARGADGRPVIRGEWARGSDIWQSLRFAVVHRPGYPFDADDLPPRARVFDNRAAGSSSDIRHRIFERRSIAGLAPPEVVTYIERHKLYRGLVPPHATRFELAELKPLLVADPWNEPAHQMAAELGRSHEEHPNLIVVMGGDGTLLRTIRREWRRRIPFYGVNIGHMGFLLNHKPPTAYLQKELVLEHMPLLWTEVERPDGSRRTALAFNDAWVERATGQTAWLQVKVNGRVRISRLVADGALVSTAAGSTSYAAAMGATPLPLNTPALLLVGSNVLRPSYFQPAVLQPTSEVELRTLDPQKRPLRGYIDGVEQGEVLSMRARVSNIASVELAFAPEFDGAEKLASIQFPLHAAYDERY